MAFAGTTSQVYITFYGHWKASEPVFLYSDEEDTFQSGHEDTFMINIGDVGEVYKIRIGHSNSGEFPAWHCEQVKLLNIFSNEQFIINVNRWLAQDQDDGEICREFPVTLHSHSQLPVTNYEIHVVTGDLWNAGTEANVYIAIHGEYGDTGSRQLVRTNKPKRFVKGQTDTFTLEAVHLGSLHTVIVGHDGLGTGNGWYLEKIIVYDPVKDKEYAFFCHRWLDEGEDDGKIARLVFIANETDFPARQELELKRKEIWHSEKWKYQKGNLLQFYCKATGKFIRLTPDSKVDALGEKKDKYGVFDVIVKRGNVRIFNSHEIKALALAIDKGKVTAMDNSGILCELYVHLQHNRCVTLESTRVPGLTVSFEHNGEAADGYTDNYAGISKEFVVHVKGIFQDEAIILLTTSWSQALCIKNEGLCSGAGKQTPDSHWRVHKISPTVCMFESVTHPKMYLCIKNGQCHGKGTGDDYCHFTVERNIDTGSVILESVRNKGIYIGLLPNGNAVTVVHTGEKNMIFYPRVIKFGRKPPAETSVTPSKKREEISKHDGELVKIQGPLAQSPSVSPPLSQTEPIKEEIHVHTPNSHEWKVSVLTGSVGTLANVTLWVYGSRGTSGPITLREDNLEQPFQPQQEDQFMVKLSNIGKIYKIRIGHDGTSDHPEWELKWVILEKMKNGKTHYFEVNRWLSRNRDSEIVCEVPVTENGTFVYPVVKYLISVYTESFEQAGTNAPVYICIYGEIGDTGKRLLLKSDFPHKFQPGQVDVFEIEAVSLGKLQKVLLVCEANHKSQYWHCKKVIIREQGKNSEYIFNCERWLPFMSQSVLHSEIELEVEDMQIVTEERQFNGEHEGDWTITIVTGNFQEAATEATVFIYVYGEGTDSGPILLGSGGHQLFNINSADTFQVNLKHLGKPYKIRIGHDNSGENSEWYLESIRLQNLSSNEDFYLPVNRWLGEEKDDGATWIELAVSAVGNHALPLVDYEIHVYTVSSAGSESTVFIKLFGTRGDSGKRKLHKSQNQTIKFQKGQVDIFRIQAISLGFLQKIQISQDGLEQGDGWLLDKIIVHYTESDSDHKVLFPCNRLLHENQENGKTEMELFPCEQQKSEPGANEEKRWIIQVKTAKDSSELKNMKVYFVLYGSEGKTGEIPLMPLSPDAECFLPGTEDQFNVSFKDIGDIYKMRIVFSALPISPGWHLRHVRVEESTSNSEIYFNCDCWLSVGTEGEEVIKEFPIVNNQQEPLPVIEYIVSVHIGDHWGAETTANVYVTVYGDRGDSGARKLRHSLPPGEGFARSKIDYFLLEAVSLGQIKKVVLGHDGEGYGAGMYLKMVTIKESQDSGTEWIFPFWNWLDNYLGLCQTVCKLYTIGRRLSTNPNPIAQSGGLWIIDITGSEYDRSEILANFDIVFYGDKGKEEVEAKIVGNIIQMKEELKNVGSLYKIRVSWSDIKLKKAWHLTSIHMKHSVTNQEMWLMADCRLKPNDENCIEIPAMYPKKDPLPVVEYAIHLHTRDTKNTGINGTVYICIEGENGDTGNRLLNISGSHRNDSKEQVDVFKIKAVHLGKLQRIVVTFFNPQKDQWFLEKIIVKDLEFSFTNYTFIHNDWITCDNEKGLTESIIMLKELTVEPYTIKHFNASTKGKWIMQVLGTQPEGENVDISFVVFGRTGKSSLLKLKNLDYSPFLVDVGNIGSIIKVSFLSMDLTYETKLQLQKVRMKDEDTKQEIGFYPGKPLLPNEDSTESVQELAAVLPNSPPLSEVSYVLQIRTGNFPASGTDADVFITVFGENGDTCKRKLRHLPLSGMFEKDKVNIFTIKAVDLGTLTKVQVEHSAVGYGAGWYLDQITIQETDKTDTEYLFPCHQWLDTGIGDKQTKCELKLLGKVSKNVGRLHTSPQGAVDVIVMVGEVENGFVSSAVSVTICCEHGNHESAVFAKGSLKQNSTSQTTVDLKKDLGPVRKLRLQMQDDAKGKNWFCKEVKLQHQQSNEILEFPFLQTFSNDGRNTVAELPAMYPDRRALIVKTYAVYVTTAQSPQIITDAKVFITLRGSIGDTGRRKFSYKRTDFTNKRKTAEFQLECVDIGVIQELFIEKEQQTNLQLEKAVVEDGKYIKKKYVFMPQQWKKEKNKMMSMTLQVTETQEGNSTEALVYGKKPLTSDGEWIIYLTMSNEEIQQPITSPPEEACDLVFVLYGDKGKSSFIVGEKGTLSRVKTLMTYKVNLINDLGDLYKVQLGFEKLNENRERLYFHHLKMQNTKTLDMFNYSINQDLPLSMNGDRWIEVPVEWPLKSTLTAVKYYVTVFATGNLNQGAGVDLSICLHGKQGDSGDRHLTWQNAEDENGEELFTSILYAVEIGEIFHVDISMSSKNDCQLHIKKIQIQESSKQEVYIFELNQDFSVIANEPAIWRKVPLSEVVHEEQESNHIRLLNFDQKEIVKDELVEHLIKVYTGDVTSAGTDAHVHIHLFGEWDSFGPVELTQQLEDHNPFERGMVDTFRILSKRLGRILHIEVGHDGKGLGSGWFLDKIEITNVTTNETALFRCSRWLSEEEDDGSTVIHLYS